MARSNTILSLLLLFCEWMSLIVIALSKLDKAGPAKWWNGMLFAALHQSLTFDSGWYFLTSEMISPDGLSQMFS